jgi:hypothetical protein
MAANRMSGRPRFAALLAILGCGLVASSLLACGGKDEGTAPENGEESPVVVSPTLPDRGTYPSAAVLDTLIQISLEELAGSPCYGAGDDPDMPEVVYVANDLVRTFAFVWIPPGWSSGGESERKMIVHLHGHCGIGAKRFCEWYEQAWPRGIAVVSLQYWMGDVDWKGGNPKPNDDYAYYVTGPGETCGWHLHIENDIAPFVEALAESYGAGSVMLHGFSMAAATATIVTYRDRASADRIDLTVFNAGHIDSTHYFFEELDSSPEPKPFDGEKFFFFLESMNPETYAKQSATRAFLLDNGVEETETVVAEGDYRHGALLNHEDFEPVRERIVAIFDSL